MGKTSNAAALLDAWSTRFFQTFRERNNFGPEDRMTSSTDELLQRTFAEAAAGLREAGVNLTDTVKTQGWLRANAGKLKMGQMLADSFSACNGPMPEPPVYEDHGATVAGSQPDSELPAAATSRKKGPRKTRGPSGPGAPVVFDDVYTRFAGSWYQKAAVLGQLPEAVEDDLKRICRDFGGRMGGKPVDLKQYRNSFSISVLSSPHSKILMAGFDQAVQEISAGVFVHAPAPAVP